MLFKIISYRKFMALQEEQRKLKDQCAELEAEISKYQQQEDHLNQELHKKDELLEEQLINLKKMGQDFQGLEEEYRLVQEESEANRAERIELTIKDLGMSHDQIKKLWSDRTELIDMYIDKLYSLAKHFAKTSKGLQKNRGLFLVLADYRNMEGSNFSEFHYGQEEHLEQDIYEGIDQLPHLFSTKISTYNINQFHISKKHKYEYTKNNRILIRNNVYLIIISSLKIMKYTFQYEL